MSKSRSLESGFFADCRTEGPSFGRHFRTMSGRLLFGDRCVSFNACSPNCSQVARRTTLTCRFMSYCLDRRLVAPPPLLKVLKLGDVVREQSSYALESLPATGFTDLQGQAG